MARGDAAVPRRAAPMRSNIWTSRIARVRTAERAIVSGIGHAVAVRCGNG
jgi:hypothetical protein